MSTRDLIGYGANPPAVKWPNGARIAVSVVVNYEEGSEYSVLDGDPRGETGGESPSPVGPGERDLANESVYEYGPRAGFWRILRILGKHRVPATFYCCALALERNSEAASAVVAAEHEVCSHGYRWEEPFTLGEAEERESIAKAVASLQRTTGQRPLGWYSRYGPSIHTRRLLVEEGGFLYDSDSYADDLPYYVDVGGRPFLVLPYSLEVNDVKFWTTGAYAHAEDFFTDMKDSLDVLHEEGAHSPKMMSVGLHLRISGRPGRSKALARFVEYAQNLGNVWFARRIDIARWWLEHYPPQT